MALKTLKIPFQATRDGRLATISGPEAIDQTVELALSPSDSSHPFQKDLGIGYDVVFSPDDPVSLARITGRVERIMARLSNQDYAALDEQSPPYFENSGEGVCVLNVSYVDRESDEPRSVSIPSP